MIRYLIAIGLTACSLTAHAITDAWSVDVNAHAAVQRTYKQGETIDLRVTLRDGLRPLVLTNAAARLYWYTNATANVWWTNAASISGSTITASWTPAMDTGAALYNYWVGIWTAGATSPLWRVTGTIRLLPSPGHTPNALTPPVRTLDFSAIAITNAPWATAADWQAGSNALASGLSDLSATVTQSTQAVAVIQSTLPGLATTGSLTAAVAPLVTTGQLTAAVAAIQAADAFWPHNATASSWFTFITNSGAITITGYDIGGGTDVVIPDYINGWPVTEIGANAFNENGVTSIGGAGNVVTVGDYAFTGCRGLPYVSLPQVQTVGDYAFMSCGGLTSVSLPQAQTAGDYAFAGCASLASVSLPQVQTVGTLAFYSCGVLASLYFDNDAPTIGADIFADITPNQVMNYVTNPQATGWGDTLGGMPVVRPTLYADAIYQAGELVATTQHVAEVKELHADSFTNLVWKSVFSNGWHWLVAYTNTP